MALVLTVAGVTSCSQDILPTDEPTDTENMEMKLVMSHPAQKVDATATDFEEGDKVGIFVTQADKPLQLGGNVVNNEAMTFSGNGWTAARTLYWDDGTYNVYAYYPYINSLSSIEDQPFSVSLDQTTEKTATAPGGYEASDFLWGKLSDVAPTSAALRLLLRHRMSSACVKLLKGEGFTESEWEGIDKTVFATNLARKASINMTDGTVKVAGSVEKLATIPLQVNDEWRAIVVPQTVPAGITLFNITIGGAPYKFAKKEAFTYVSGKMMKFNIRVDKAEGNGKYRLTLVSESIAPWENDLQSHDATATEYVVINSTAGHLKDSIVASHKDIAMVKCMKVTGIINHRDFIMMRDSMPKLTALNLKDVRIKVPTNGSIYTEWKDDEIPFDCFSGKKTLTSIVLPDVLKSIGRDAFADSGLKHSLYIPEGVVEIGNGAFARCDFTGVLTLPSTLKTIGGGAFRECCFICPLNLPDGIEEIGSECFQDCRNLYGKLILPSHLNKMGSSAFRGCTGFKGDLVIPKSLTVIPWLAFYACGLGGRLQLHDGITTIDSSAFGHNGFIGELELPKSLTELGSANFHGNNFSGRLKIPKGLTNFSFEAFAYNTFAGEVEIPEGVTYIEMKAFAESKNLQKVILPSELRLIDVEAFLNCESLRVIECKSTVPPAVNDGAFNGVPLEDLTVIVPKSALNDYKSSDFWSGLLLKTVE